MSNEVTQHQVQGTCEVVQMRGDWMEFHVDIGKQYPVKLASKQPAVKDAAQAAVAAKAVAVWSYSERDGNPNPHRPGEFFKNRYLESVVIGGELDPALANQPQTHQQEQPGAQQLPSSAGREISIERQTIVKAMAPLLGIDGYDEDKFFASLDRLDDWMGRNRAEPDATKPEAAPEQQQDDDDIPF
jgi:hypothetical protein